MGKQLSFYLTETEAQALNASAQRNCRRMSDQARYILLTGLGVITPEPPANQGSTPRQSRKVAQGSANAQPSR